jgi:hypothetical protein
MSKRKKELPANNHNQTASVQKGDNYQAGGDIHIYTPDPSKTPAKPNRLSTWQSVIAILVGISTILITILFTVPEKLGLKENKTITTAPDSILVSGIIREKGSDKGIPNAWITSDLTIPDTILTTSAGTFELTVAGKAGKSIRIFTGAAGYTSRNEYHTLPQAISIELQKQ